MADAQAAGAGDGLPPRTLGWAALTGVLALYAALVLIATYPAVLTCGTKLAVADSTDPMQHLWCLRWYRTCLRNGSSPLFCPDVQRPQGSPLGLYSPLQLQLPIYLTCSIFTNSDTIIYNTILFTEFLFTGLGTFVLAWYLTRHFWGSVVAGLLAMLSGPMMFAASSGGTELAALGGFPLFLVGWLRFVDQPTRGRLFAALGLYLLLAAGAPYYGVLGVFTAVLYVVMQAFGDGRRGVWPWLKTRLGWLIAFSVLTAATAPLLFPAQIWAVVHGYSMGRSRLHFEQLGTTVWHYLIPTPDHRLLTLVLPRFWVLPELSSRPTVYLGVVTLGLLGYSAVRRVRFRHSRYLWVCLAMFAVLSFGASWTIGERKVSLPASWLWDWFPPFRSLRVPARFGYFGALCAAVLAGGALKPLMEQAGRNKAGRAAIILGLAVLAVADLATVPYACQTLPPMPACYTRLLRSKPDATFCEVHPTEGYVSYESTLTYWQGLHGGRTSAGNPGVTNRLLEHRALLASPFHYSRLGNPFYLSDPGPTTFDLVQGANFEDYAWLYLTVHQFDYLILHKWTWNQGPPPPPLLQIRQRLERAIVMEDEATVVFDRNRMKPPARPVLIGTEGWRDRIKRRGEFSAVVAQNARLELFNPTPNRNLQLELTASSYLEPRTVRLLADGRELTRWRIQPAEPATFASPSFQLTEGRHELTLASDGASRPTRAKFAPVEGDQTPFSLWVSGVKISGP